MGQCLKKASITPQTDETGRALSDGQQESRRCVVDFNPETLEYNLSGTTASGRGNRPAQSVSESTSRLTMELVFDTTTTGSDVRYKTHKLVQMFDPVQNNGGGAGAGGGIGGAGSPSDVPSQNDAPPQDIPQSPSSDEPRRVPSIVIFEWGTIRFEGYISSYSETMELFSSEGIPLRCAVSLTITQQERSFAPPDKAQTASGINGQLDLGSSAMSLNLGAGVGLSMSMSVGIGASGSMKGIAEFNGIESLRMPEVDSVLVAGAGAGGGPVAFSAGAGAGFGAGIGIGGGAGISAGGSATASAFAGLNTQASAGVSMSGGASLGIGLGASSSGQIGLGGNSNFCTGGAATNQGSGSMSAEVGINASLSAGIEFGGR
jgi:hypothetical protein